MLNFLKNFRKDEDGAVTVDWVVLTAAVVALGGAAYTAIEGGAEDLSEAIEDELGGVSVDAGF
ncbi:hypothetical protein [Aestuariivita sp.]|jgi:Flp pilus assembly pilin Flp|uniref:hypothetical protein n=1 Tax=Aestuariivita sp. TaxID=1872407 RepID=UPI00216D32AE|nr:hypothetical protein [Aestuariivita sp.]MCE8005876.1 hypothetical protein [Aestuariivita sp.]